MAVRNGISGTTHGPVVQAARVDVVNLVVLGEGFVIGQRAELTMTALVTELLDADPELAVHFDAGALTLDPDELPADLRAGFPDVDRLLDAQHRVLTGLVERPVPPSRPAPPGRPRDDPAEAVRLLKILFDAGISATHRRTAARNLARFGAEYTDVAAEGIKAAPGERHAILATLEATERQEDLSNLDRQSLIKLIKEIRTDPDAR